ncbi:MAG: carbamoyltransferase HypF [bacterium]
MRGLVQGVGFRPFVARLADRIGLAGRVRNTGGGVEIRLEGTAAELDRFESLLLSEAPPLARIHDIISTGGDAEGLEDFRILHSGGEEGASQPVTPDIATCEDCLREMADPSDRRYRYPFTNCTNCGPRFTIVRDVPYDRPRTTMSGFPLCEACAAEYTDPLDRRYHAQPVACPLCGPSLTLEAPEGRVLSSGDEALREVREALAAGRIAAVKGLGGYHLVCDASDEEAVRTLRTRKGREGRPFALMAPDVPAVASHCRLGPRERDLLTSPERPIVLLARREEDTLPRSLAPGLHRLGFMLPYTPLHHLLLEPAEGMPRVLVMTSGNLSEEPIAYRDEEARERLAPLADLILTHDRPIHMRCDDSVAALAAGGTLLHRRARGWAPMPLSLSFDAPHLLAAGADLKNTFCLAREDRAYLSHHIGDLDDVATLRAWEEGVEHYARLFRVEPEVVVCDLHPDYRSTLAARRLAEERDLPLTAVQHHHAHAAACMAEHGLRLGEEVIAVSFDGTGYGTDGAIWGGEFLIASYTGSRRFAHLPYVPLPGGEAAMRRPYRMAMAWLRHAEVLWYESLPPLRTAGDEERTVLDAVMRRGLNSPPTSSAGRLFDAVSSLAGICQEATWEAQAACELEAAADPAEEGGYPFTFSEGILDPSPMIREAAGDVRAGLDPGRVSMRFHRGLARGITTACRAAREASGRGRVVLSGGVWQNTLLLELTLPLLEAEGMEVLVHRQLPPGDGGIALGQAAVAAARAATGEVTDTTSTRE